MIQYLSMKRSWETTFGVAILVAAVCTLFLYAAGTFGRSLPVSAITWGVTFGAPHARYLGLEPHSTLNALLDDLGVRHFRLSAYWNQSEQVEGTYDFSDIDWQLDAVEERGGKVLMGVGRRLPRWPECHDPSWLATKTPEEQDAAHLAFLQASVEHLRTHAAVAAWQIENEPYLRFFGKCPPPNGDLIKKEIELIRSLDSRPIVMTESGELSTWRHAATQADVVATSIYRRVLFPVFGLAPHILLPPAHYRLKADLVHLFTRKQVMNTELQMEPWSPTDLRAAPEDSWSKTMSPAIFKKNISFAAATGIPTHYLWGAEWWYFMKTKRANSSYWDLARQVFLKK